MSADYSFFFKDDREFLKSRDPPTETEYYCRVCKFIYTKSKEGLVSFIKENSWVDKSFKIEFCPRCINSEEANEILEQKAAYRRALAKEQNE